MSGWGIHSTFTINTMSYSIYISYSMSDSSKAYDLSGKLSREKISYYLDCVESGFTLSDYTKQVIEECEAFVALVGMSYTEEKYSHDTLRHAIEHGKRIVVCPIEGAPLPELQVPYTTVNEENLLALLMGGNVDDDDDVDVDDNCLPDGLTVDRRPLLFPSASELRLTVDHQETVDHNEDDNENYHWNETVDCRPLLFPSASELRLTVDDKNDDDELIEHRGTPPPPTQPLISDPSLKKNGCRLGCALLAYAFVVIMIANFCIKFITGDGIVELGREFIDTLIENRKSPLERHYESISYEDRKKGEVLYDRGMNFMKEASANPNARDKALACFEEAAALGNVEAMYFAGMCYQKSADGDRKLLEKATKHLYDATVAGKPDCFAQLMNIAEKNIAYAQNCVGVCYAHGYSVERNQMKAVEWYIKAARNGNYAAKYNLAWYYRYGQGGLPKNKHMAYKLYEELAAINYEDAQKLMKEVSKEL